ncbi:MAG: MFS transporter, partial [Raoultibacter sp.]
MQQQTTTDTGSSRILLLMLLGCSFTASFGQNMMSVALPETADRFAITLSMANWLVVGYMVVAATAITLAAFLLSRLGLRRVFFVGIGSFVVGSGVALLAPDFYTLLGGRLLQAVGTGLFYPTVTGAIMATTPRARLGTHLALNSAVIAVGLAIAPLASGFALTYFGWHALFVVPLILSALLLGAGFFALHDIAERKKATVDVLSVALSLVGLGSLMYGLSEITHDFVPSAIALLVGLVLIVLFAWRQLVLPEPLLNVRALGHPRFTLALVLVMVGMMTSLSLSVLLPLYYEGSEGRTAFLAGLLLLGPVLVNAALSYAGGKLFDRWGIWPLVFLGFVGVLGGLVAVYFSSEHLITILVVLGSALSYAGLGLAVSPSKTIALSQLPPELYAHGAAINSTFVQIASALGPSLFVGVLSSDVLKATAVGLSKQEAYARGFSHTL